MALNKTNIPISFAGTLDTKTNSKSVIPGNFQVLENAVFTEPGALLKRNGLDLLGNHINLSDAQIIKGQALSVFQDQMLLFDGEQAYSKLTHNDKWNAKGAVSSIINKSYQIVRNGFSQNNPDGNKVDNVECYAWEDSRGGIRYSLVDSKTGNFIVSDNLLHPSGLRPKVLMLNAEGNISSQFVIIYMVGTNLYCSRIYTNALTIAPLQQILADDLSLTPRYDACVCFGEQDVNSTLTINNHILVAYSNDASTPRILKITAAANVSIYQGSPGGNNIQRISISSIPDLSIVNGGITGIVLWSDGTNLFVGKLNLISGNLISTQLTLPVIFEVPALSRLAIIWNGKPFNTQFGCKLFFEFSNGNATLQYCRSADLDVAFDATTLYPSSMENIVLKKGIGLYSKPWLHNNSVYIATVHDSTYQSTYFVVSNALEVISKANQTVAGGLRTSLLAEPMMDSYVLGKNVYTSFSGALHTYRTPVCNGIFSFPTLKKGKIESEDNTIFTLLGVLRSTFDFVSPNHFLASEINDNLYVVGGVLQNYDGNKFTEAGFHLYPENVILDNTSLVITIAQSGDPTNNQVSSISWLPASRLVPGDVFLLSSANNDANYSVWFNIDNQGSAPNLSGYTPIRVNIQSYFTGAQVANAVRDTVLANAAEFTITTSFNQMIIGNIAPGISNGVLPGSINLGNISPGTYLYICVWKYIDNAGRIHRSATSIAQSITTTTTGSISITVPVLSPTAKDNVILEVYRTESLGQIPRRVSSITNPTFNNRLNQDPGYTSVSFVDISADEDILANEILYTYGDVLDNDSPPPCSLIATFKNRLFIAGLDERNLIQYTKLIDPSEKQFIAGFSDALYLELDSRGGEITGLTAMDDKLIIFKETQIFFISGDGPNNTGDPSTDFSQPQLVSTDVGCDNPNSIVLTPNGLLFHSPKGIYQLDRGLNVSYIGAAVERYNDLTISSSVLLNNKNQVRFMTENGNALVYDYYVQKWTTFTNYEAVDCDIFNGKFTLLRSNGLTLQENDNSFKDQVDFSTYKHISLVAETADIAIAGMLGFQRIYRVFMLGEYKGAHQMKVSVSYDYAPQFIDQVIFDATSNTGGNTYGAGSPYGSDPVYGGYYQPYMFRAHLQQQKCSAIRIRLEDIQTANFNEGLNISGISLEVGVKGSNKLPFNKTIGTK